MWQPPDSDPAESGMREFPPHGEHLKPRDRMPIIVVPATTWHCVFCQADGGEGAGTTVEWLSGTHPMSGPDGRCRECGQKFVLADSLDRHIPTPEEQS